MKLISLGVAAKIIVIVKNEDARGTAGLLAIEIGRRQTTDAATDHDQIVFLAGVDRLAGFIPEGSVAQCVCDFERPGMTSPHSVERWRIVAGPILRGSCRRLRREHSPQPRAGKGSTHSHRHAVQEIAARDVAVHAEFAIARSMTAFMYEVRHFFYTPFSCS